MRVFYDSEVDALYLQLGDGKPDGVDEIGEGVNLDLTEDGKLVGIEILEASKKMDIHTILSYSIELTEEVLSRHVA